MQNPDRESLRFCVWANGACSCEKNHIWWPGAPVPREVTVEPFRASRHVLNIPELDLDTRKLEN